MERRPASEMGGRPRAGYIPPVPGHGHPTPHPASAHLPNKLAEPQTTLTPIREPLRPENGSPHHRSPLPAPGDSLVSAGNPSLLAEDPPRPPPQAASSGHTPGDWGGGFLWLCSQTPRQDLTPRGPACCRPHRRATSELRRAHSRPTGFPGGGADGVTTPDDITSTVTHLHAAPPKGQCLRQCSLTSLQLPPPHTSPPPYTSGPGAAHATGPGGQRASRGLGS